MKTKSRRPLKKEQCNFYINPDQKQKVNTIAEAEGESGSNILRLAIKEYIDKWEDENGEIEL